MTSWCQAQAEAQWLLADDIAADQPDGMVHCNPMFGIKEITLYEDECYCSDAARWRPDRGWVDLDGD